MGESTFNSQLALYRELIARRPAVREIVRRLALGNSRRTVAVQLGCSAHTVDWHLRRLYRDLRVNSIAQVVYLDMLEGTAPSPPLNRGMARSTLDMKTREATEPYLQQLGGVMNSHNAVRAIAFCMMIWSVLSPSGGSVTTDGVCYSACVQGTGGTCGSPSEQAAACIEAGCSGALAGCVENFGNCEGGYPIQCNTMPQ